MKRFQLLVMVAAITAAAIWWGLYRSRHNSSAAVATLLPKETLAFIHVPDFNRSHADLHKTDIYQMWSEPAVQDFLQKPRSKIPKNEGVGQTVQEIESLEMKDVFIALISIEYSAWKIVGGFRCKGDAAASDKVVGNWKEKLLGHGPDLKHETVDYQGHQIQTDSSGIVRFASVHDGPWFLFANDPDQLKALLDRVDGRTKDPAKALATDDVFAAASKHMPANYAALVYTRIDQILGKIMPSEEKSADVSAEQMAIIRQIRSFCGVISFEGGKIRDTLFVGMPKLFDPGNLARVSLPVATKDTFLYAAGFLNLKDQMPMAGSQAASWLSGLQKFTDTFAAKGITLESWNSAFGPEFGLVGDWAATSHWPSLFATLPVKDSAKANQILTALTTADSNDTWTHQEKDGVHYFSTRAGGQFLSLSPTLGLSDRMLIAGADANSVEAAMKRSASGNSELAASKAFQEAERAVAKGEQAFTYIDPALIYLRLDATVRPMLFMGAAFVPGIADTVDLSKVPAPEVITKHLSPIVMSQRYDHDGYVAESMGPVTANQALFGVAAIGGAAAFFYHQQTQSSTHDRVKASPAPAVVPAISPSISISPSPSPSPDDSE
jgi:hypothetical protein